MFYQTPRPHFDNDPPYHQEWVDKATATAMKAAASAHGVEVQENPTPQSPQIAQGGSGGEVLVGVKGGRPTLDAFYADIDRTLKESA